MVAETIIILRHLWLDYPIGPDPASWDVGNFQKSGGRRPQHIHGENQWKTLIKMDDLEGKPPYFRKDPCDMVKEHVKF